MQSSGVVFEVVEPYAQAFMSLAKDQDLVDKFGEDVAGILELLADSQDLPAVLTSPMVNVATKKQILRQVLSEQVHAYTLNFVLLLVDQGRIGFLSGICEQYQTLLRQLRGLVLAEVISSRELTGSQCDQVVAKVKHMTGATGVELKTIVDESVLGGVIIRVGSQVIDASLRSQLRRIGLKLAGAIA